MTVKFSKRYFWIKIRNKCNGQFLTQILYLKSHLIQTYFVSGLNFIIFFIYFYLFLIFFLFFIFFYLRCSCMNYDVLIQKTCFHLKLYIALLYIITLINICKGFLAWNIYNILSFKLINFIYKVIEKWLLFDQITYMLVTQLGSNGYSCKHFAFRPVFPTRFVQPKTLFFSWHNRSQKWPTII